MSKVSVVMATYNGEKYILEQLQSILDQTRKPDEVLIQDDGSSDDTEKIVCSFIQKNNLNNWHFKRNSTNLGYRKNFMDMLMKSSGDVIFFCDQDDVWQPEKIEKMSSVFERHSEVNVLCHEYELLLEEDGSNSYERLTDTIPTSESNLFKVPLTNQNLKTMRVGWTLGVRASFAPIMQKAWLLDESIAHDMVAWFSAIVYDSAYLLKETLGKWRRHRSSTSVSEYYSKEEQDKYEWMKKGMIRHFKERARFLQMLMKLLSEENIKDKKEELAFISTIEENYERCARRLENKQFLFTLVHFKEYDQRKHWIVSLALSFEWLLRVYFKLQAKK